MQIFRSLKASDESRGQSSESHVICAMSALFPLPTYSGGRCSWYSNGRGKSEGGWSVAVPPVCNNSGDFVNTNLSACYVLVSVQLLHVSRRQKKRNEKKKKSPRRRSMKSNPKERASKVWRESERRQDGKTKPEAAAAAAATTLNVSNIFFLLFCLARRRKVFKAFATLRENWIKTVVAFQQRAVVCCLHPFHPSIRQSVHPSIRASVSPSVCAVKILV